MARAQTSAPLPASAMQQISELLAEKESRTTTQRKISSGLLHAARAQKGLPITANVPALGLSVPLRTDGRADVDVLGKITQSTIDRIVAAGGEPIGAKAGASAIRVALPLDKLEDVAGLSEVTSVRPALRAMTHAMLAKRKTQLRSELLTALQLPLPSRPLFVPLLQQGVGFSPVTNAGSVADAGSKAQGADRARNWFGVDGTGVKIGVLSDSDDFKEAAIASGDLPADTVTVPGQDGRPGSGEGTAMMEIVHDVAPGAKVFFATAFNSPESFADNIRTLRFTYGCDIIVDDVIYFAESAYQDDIMSQAVLDVTADGATYFSSAGNEGNFDDGTSGTWEGDFKKAAVSLAALPAGYEVHNFGRGVLANRITVGGGPLYLHWADPSDIDHPVSTNDYDLFLLDAALQNVAVASTDIQNGPGSLPFEFLGFNIPAGFQVVIARKAGAADRAMRVQLAGGALALATSGATWGHNSVDSTGAYGVAAADAAQAAGGEFVGGTTTQIEQFSSDGNRRIFYDRDGNLINGDPTFNGNGGLVRKKPDLTGADGVATTLPSSSGLNPFFGTSAAAPHAAAVAGLLKSAKPTITDTKMRNALTKGATDIEAVGRDRDSGVGITNAFDALTFLGVTPKPFLELGAVTVNPSPAAFLAPGGTAAVNVQLNNNGGATASNLHGTLSTTTPGFHVTDASGAWVDIASAASGTTSDPFAISVDPSVACGFAATMNLLTTFNAPNSPKTFTFKVQTGQTSTTTIVNPYTGPITPIPDNNGAGVNIPITISGVGAIGSLDFHIGGTTPCSAAAGATTVGLDHTFVGDLTMTLTSPAGTTVTLMSHPGGSGNSGNNFCQTVLTDSAAASIQTISVAGAPWQGSFKPANPLSVFKGENANGTWILNVSDTAFIDVGSVRSFSLDIRGFSCQ